MIFGPNEFMEKYPAFTYAKLLLGNSAGSKGRHWESPVCRICTITTYRYLNKKFKILTVLNKIY